MTAPAKRRWTYSLRTLFVVVTLFGTVGYWLVQVAQAKRAREAYARACAYREAEMMLESGVCRASRQLFDAEVALPFANRTQAAAAHLGRVQEVYDRVRFGPAYDYVVTDSERVEVERCHAEAERLVAENR